MDRIHKRRTLPHWQTDDGIYFITFRLADSLPRDVLLRICKDVRATPQHTPGPSQHLQVKRLPPRVEKFLDSGAGACYLARPDVAAIAAQALAKFAGVRYRLVAWCVMPNHLHVIVQSLDNWALPHIIHSWKSFTAKQANRILQRTGEFWQREYYDHIVRNGEDLARIVRYVLENPGRAGLPNWPWVGTKPWTPNDASKRLP
jgi:REP element-mobilizing transposase RayT